MKGCWSRYHYFEEADVYHRVTKTTMDNDRIKTLPTDPLELTGTPTGNRLLVPHLVQVYIDASAGAYTNIGAACSMWVGVTLATSPQTVGRQTSFLANDSGVSPAITKVSDLFGAASSNFGSMTIRQKTNDGSTFDLVGDVIQGIDAYWDRPLALWVDNSASDFTGGHANNSGIVICHYWDSPTP